MGTVAAQSIATGEPANDVDTRRLVQTLREPGAHQPQGPLARDLTRQ